jgi:hypothetical protein
MVVLNSLYLVGSMSLVHSSLCKSRSCPDTSVSRCFGVIFHSALGSEGVIEHVALFTTPPPSSSVTPRIWVTRHLIFLATHRLPSHLIDTVTA